MSSLFSPSPIHEPVEDPSDDPRVTPWLGLVVRVPYCIQRGQGPNAQPSLWFDAVVLDGRVGYGRLDLKVKPVEGLGVEWVSAARVIKRAGPMGAVKED